MNMPDEISTLSGPVEENRGADENSTRVKNPKGDLFSMSSVAEAFKEKPAPARHHRRSASESQAKNNRFEKTEKPGENRFFNRFRLESLMYRLAKPAAMVSILALYQLQNYMQLNPAAWLAVSAVAIFIYIVLPMRLPGQNLVPLRNKRTDIRSFISCEFKFALLATGAVFFSGINISAAALGSLLAINTGLQTILFVAWRFYNMNPARRQNIRQASRSEKNVIIFGSGKRGRRAADIFLKYPDLNIRVLGFVDFKADYLWRYRDIPLIGKAGHFDRIINTNQVDTVVMAPEPDDYSASQAVFDLLEKMGVDICVLPFIYDRKISTCCASAVNGQPMLLYRSVKHNASQKLAKDVMDKIGALVGLLIASPVLILSAIAIKLDSRGPIFYRQKRSGINGKTFDMLKLRTMVNDAEKQKEKLQHLNEMSGPVFKIKNDPRVTRIGKLLRKFSIDEFPQFINVLKGDMSLVGPRPPLPSEVAQYEPWQRRKLSVKPGATCLWQINGRNHIDFERWTMLDLQYIDQWSLKEDARILLKTIPAVLKGNGAS